jgi:hypothetical protein
MRIKGVSAPLVDSSNVILPTTSKQRGSAVGGFCDVFE